MKIIEILELNRGLLRICGRIGVKADDVEYIDLFNDYNEMVANGEKVSYAVAVVSERYGVCERKVYSLVKRFNMECNGLISNRGGVNATH